MGCGSCAQKNIEQSKEKSGGSAKKPTQENNQLNDKNKTAQNNTQKENQGKANGKNKELKADLISEENTEFVSIENQSKVIKQQKEEKVQNKTQNAQKEDISKKQAQQQVQKPQDQITQNKTNEKAQETKQNNDKTVTQTKDAKVINDKEEMQKGIVKVPRQGEEKEAAKYLQSIYSKNIRRISQDQSQISTNIDNTPSYFESDDNWNQKDKIRIEVKNYLLKLYNRVKLT